MILGTPRLAALLSLRNTVGLLAIGLLAPACEQRLPEFRYETEHLRIATDFDEPLCRGDLDHYESVITRLETVLDTNVEGRTDVYLWELSMSSPGWCALENAGGCLRDGVVYADIGSIDHELVHVVVASFGNPATFWNEGSATSLQSERTYFNGRKPSDHLDLEAPYLDYHTAGHFSRWLFETYGIELYRALLRAPGNARQAFEQTYEMTIEEAQEQYFAQVPYSYATVIGCDAPELPLIDEMRWSETLEVDCDNQHVYGGPFGMGAYRVLTIVERGDYAFSTTGESGVISACRDVVLETPAVEGDPAFGDVPPYDNHYLSLRPIAGAGAITTLDLLPGRYEVVIGYATFERQSAQLDVQLAPP